MGKQHLSRDDRIFMDGKRRGTQECMDMVAMALIKGESLIFEYHKYHEQFWRG